MKPLTKNKVQKKCKRCNRNLTQDIICPSCKNELIAMYDNKLGWRTAYEIEKVSRSAMHYKQRHDEEEWY